MKSVVLDWKALRGEFPTLAHWTYLDVARKTIPPRRTSRDSVEAARPIHEAIVRSDRPANNPRLSSSRSCRLNLV